VKKISLIIVVLVVLMVILTASDVYATDWWSSANTFFNESDWRNHRDDTILSDIKNIVKMVGNAAFVIVTVVLGIKYMASSAEGKGDVKEGLTSLLVAIVLFYGWTAIDNILTRDGGAFDWFFDTTTYELTITRIAEKVISILNYVAVGVLLFVGIKYIFSGADGKAELKGKGLPFIIGLVMTFATLSFLNFLIEVVGEVVG